MKKKLFSKSKSYYKGPTSDHFDGIRFYNPWNPILPKSSDLIRWKISAKPKPWSKKIKAFSNDIPPNHIEGNTLRISFVGHSTMLIQTAGLNILTDPIWSKRASPFKWFGPKRYTKPGISFEGLPKIDLILISHNHYDHLDLHTIRKLWVRDRPKIIAPLGNDTIIQSSQADIAVETLDWYQSITFNKNVSIHLEPAQHWSARGILDKNKALWGAFVIQTPGGNIYFAGDTGYGNGELFRQTLQRFKNFRLAMLPIGAYEPLWFMHYAHMNPEDAVSAYKDLGEPYTAAIHHQTFKLGDEGQNDPTTILNQALKKLDRNEKKFRSLHVGESWIIPENNSKTLA